MRLSFLQQHPDDNDAVPNNLAKKLLIILYTGQKNHLKTFIAQALQFRQDKVSVIVYDVGR